VTLCVYSGCTDYLLEVLKTELHCKVYYGVRVNCLGEDMNWRWMAKELINQLICLYILIQFHLCFDCDWQAAIARARSKIYNEKSAQYCEAAYWDRYNVHGLCEVKKEFANPLTKPLARRLVSKASRGIGLIPKLWHCDWYPTSVIGDHMNEV
jgi:hypothetical protein